MKERYCKNDRCKYSGDKPCAAWENCMFFMWDIDREKEKVYGNPKNSILKVPTEEEEQKEFFAWCKAHRIEMVHIPNERKASVPVMASLQAQGLRKGFPDNFIPYPIGGYHGLFIEMKREKKSLSTVSPEQKDWITGLNKQGYKAVVCYGADEAKSAVREYFGKEENKK